LLKSVFKFLYSFDHSRAFSCDRHLAKDRHAESSLTIKKSSNYLVAYDIGSVVIHWQIEATGKELMSWFFFGKYGNLVLSYFNDGEFSFLSDRVLYY
jgi:hypothetical protein